MGNTSIYFTEEEEEWIENNIKNLSEFVRNKIKEEQNKHEILSVEENKIKRRTILFYSSAFGIGMIVLVFSIILNLSEFRTVIYLSIESLLLIIMGLGLEAVAISKLYTYKNRGKNGKKI